MAFGEVGGEGGGASGAREPLLEPDALDEASGPRPGEVLRLTDAAPESGEFEAAPARLQHEALFDRAANGDLGHEVMMNKPLTQAFVKHALEQLSGHAESGDTHALYEARANVAAFFGAHPEALQHLTAEDRAALAGNGDDASHWDSLSTEHWYSSVFAFGRAVRNVFSSEGRRADAEREKQIAGFHAVLEGTPETDAAGYEQARQAREFRQKIGDWSNRMNFERGFNTPDLEGALSAVHEMVTAYTALKAGGAHDTDYFREHEADVNALIGHMNNKLMNIAARYGNLDMAVRGSKMNEEAFAATYPKDFAILQQLRASAAGMAELREMLGSASVPQELKSLKQLVGRVQLAVSFSERAFRGTAASGGSVEVSTPRAAMRLLLAHYESDVGNFKGQAAKQYGILKAFIESDEGNIEKATRAANYLMHTDMQAAQRARLGFPKASEEDQKKFAGWRGVLNTA